MEISALNITDSIRSLYDKAYQPFLRIGQLITQIWNKSKGNQQPIAAKESFISYIKDHDFTLVKPTKVIKFTIPDNTPEVDFDIIKREFDSLQLRNAIENEESVFFEDDFVSTSDWADTAVQDQKDFDSYITPIIEEADIEEQQFASQIQDELNAVNATLKKFEEEVSEEILLAKQSHNDFLINLKKEKQENLGNQLKTLEEEFAISKQKISNFQSKTENLADEYMDVIAQANEKYNFHSKKLSKKVKNLVKQRKQFAASTAKKSLEKLNNDFKVKSLQIHKKINVKYQEKEKIATETFQENLQSIEEAFLKEKQTIRELSDEKIDSIKSEIQSLRQKFLTSLSSVERKNKEAATSFDIPEENKSISDTEEKAPLPISLEENRLQEKENHPKDSIMTTISKTYNLIWENLSGALVNSYSFHF